MAVGGRVSDVLGLGDVAFPAMLVGWARRYALLPSPDPPTTTTAAAPANRRGSVHSAALVGYGVGCLLCEVFQTGRGQPALLYVVPAMLAAVAIAGAATGDVGGMWAYGLSDDGNEAPEEA